jgi:hypothetical protein
MMFSRRFVVSGGLALFAAPVMGQDHHHGGLYEHLRKPGRIDLPPIAGGVANAVEILWRRAPCI